MNNTPIEDLKNFYLNNSITQEELAKNLQIHQTSLSRYFNEKAKPSKKLQHRIKKFLEQEKHKQSA